MAETISAKKGKKDQYANVAYGNIAMSAANTLTFAQILFAVGLFQGVAIILHRVLWFPGANAIRELVAATDDLQLALTTSNRLTGITAVREPAILAIKHIIGVGAGVERQELPLISDFQMLPGGGKLIPANPLYFAMTSGGFVSAQGAMVQLEFTFIELAAADYLELIQSQYPANIA
jgi:hypothetical protein